MKKKITELVVVGKKPDKFRIDLSKVPKHEMDNLCRSILRLTKKVFSDPKLVAEYETWLPQWQARQKAQTTGQ